MHAHHLADLAALVAVHSRPLVATDTETLSTALTAYWQASRCRLDRWCHSLRRLTIRNDQWQWSPEADRVMEEILVSTILTRTVAAVASAHDGHHDVTENGPVARNILGGHLDARRRALSLVASAAKQANLQAEALQALARQCDRWSDLVLAYVATHANVDEFAASPARVHDFSFDARHHIRSATAARTALAMIATGMQSSLERIGEGRVANPDLNREVAASILGLFQGASFDSHGMLMSAEFLQLARVVDESPPKSATLFQPASTDPPHFRAARWHW